MKKPIAFLFLLIFMSIYSCSSELDIDVAKSKTFGCEVSEISLAKLTNILGKPNDLRMKDGRIEACFYDKGVYYQFIKLGVEKINNKQVMTAIYQLTIFLSHKWDGVEKSIYSVYQGKISKNIDSLWTQNKLLKNFSSFQKIDKMKNEIELDSGALIEVNWGESSKWNKDDWEIANFCTCVESNKIGRVEYGDKAGISIIFYEVSSGLIKWITIYQYVASPI